MKNDNDELDKQKTIEKTASDGREPNVGTGPTDRINNGGNGGATQPKEHTGKDTEMGGATGGTHGLGDRGEGNDNTSRE